MRSYHFSRISNSVDDSSVFYTGTVDDEYTHSFSNSVHDNMLEDATAALALADRELTAATGNQQPPLPVNAAKRLLNRPGYPSIGVKPPFADGSKPGVDSLVYRLSSWSRDEDAHPDLDCASGLMKMAHNKLPLEEHQLLSRTTQEAVARVYSAWAETQDNAVSTLDLKLYRENAASPPAEESEKVASVKSENEC